MRCTESPIGVERKRRLSVTPDASSVVILPFDRGQPTLTLGTHLGLRGASPKYGSTTRGSWTS